MLITLVHNSTGKREEFRSKKDLFFYCYHTSNGVYAAKPYHSIDKMVEGQFSCDVTVYRGKKAIQKLDSMYPQIHF